MPVRSSQDVYATHLSSSRGYPIWSPKPSTKLLSIRPEGLRIGDVGVVVPHNGNFDVFFNLCMPKDHEFHRSIGVPEGFSHVELSDTDIETATEAETANQIFSSSSVTRVGGGSDEAPRAEQHTFRMSSNEGAVLVLPDGAERHDVRDPRPFFEQAALHGSTWYRFAEEKLGRVISHDAIYVVTGLHKARSWGVAEYHNEPEDGEFIAKFHADGSVTKYEWESARSMEWSVGPTADSSGVSNQTVFIRGFKIALRRVGRRGAPQRSVTFQHAVRPNHTTSSASGESWLANVWRGISKGIRPSGDGGERDRRAGPDSRENVGTPIEIQRKPEIAQVFHPSDVINQYILQKEPSAKVAITHDSEWGSLFDQGLLKPEELIKEALLTKAVSERFTVVLRNGVAYLQSSSGSDARAHVSTKDLPDAVATNGSSKETINKVVEVEREEATAPRHPESINVVSESNYRCTDPSSDECVLILNAPEQQPADLRSIPSKPPTLEQTVRTIKTIVISDYICSFCYICDKILRDAIEACRDLPVRFDVEFRPFVLVNPISLPIQDPNQVVYRNAYLVQRFGKEEAELKIRAVEEFAQKTGLKLMEDNILCGTVPAHRLSSKAFKEGGQSLQQKFNSYIFEACLSRGLDISDENLLIDAAVSVGLMNREEAAEFLQSTEYVDCVEKMVEAARAQGINGVPFVIIDGKWAVNGVQPVECFIQIFRKLAQLPDPSSCPEKAKAEHAAGVH